MEREDKFFVIATKGFGKTLLLKAKRIYYEQKGRNIPCLPEGSLLDKPLGDKIFSRDMLELYNSVQSWSNLWLASIIITILKYTETLNVSDLNPNIASLINDSELRTVTDHFVNILGLERNNFFEIVKICEHKFIPKIKNIHTPIAIFIDNVDEYFNKHIINQEQTSPTTIGMTSPLVWYYSQIGLVDTIYKLFRVNHHIKIFASIRKEAFLKLAEYDSMIQQYLGVSIDIAYSYPALKEIFLKNIVKESSKNLVHPLKKDTDLIVSFLGISEVTHEYTQEKEDIFDYIYRHTLLRPRDFMTIGGKISQLAPRERNEDILKKLINKAATEIADQYINEFLPHMGEMNLKKILSLIKSNSLSEKEVKNICSKFNNISCVDRDCKGCQANHIFCDLFKVGLLGYIRKEPVSGQEIQTFVIPGEKTFAQSGVLPPSSYYLIHPVLDEKIRAANTEYEDNIDKVNIVGYDRLWKESFEITGGVQILDKISEGATSIVYSARATKNLPYAKIGDKLAVKLFFKMPDSRILQRFKTEVTIGISLRSEYLVKYYYDGIYETRLEKRLFIIMELIEGQKLKATFEDLKWMDNNKRNSYLLNILTDILNALKILHDNKIIHRDLQPSNILVRNSKAVLIDYGASKYLTGDNITNNWEEMGTRRYWAPECLGQGENRWSPQTDVFMLASCMVHLLTGKYLFNDALNYSDFYEKLRKYGKQELSLPEIEELPNWLLPEIKNQLHLMLTPKFEDRPAIKDLIHSMSGIKV